MSLACVTELTCLPLTSWLKAYALKNICFMVVTELTFHPPMSWLKADAKNMYFMVVTELHARLLVVL